MKASADASARHGFLLTTAEERKKYMARKTVLISDLSGQEINEPARVTITFPDSNSGAVVLDVNASEVHDLINKGRRQARRGRPAKVAAHA